MTRTLLIGLNILIALAFPIAAHAYVSPEAVFDGLDGASSASAAYSSFSTSRRSAEPSSASHLGTSAALETTVQATQSSSIATALHSGAPIIESGPAEIVLIFALIIAATATFFYSRRRERASAYLD